MAASSNLSIDNIRSAMALGGQRSALFRVVITNPSDSSADSIAPFRVKSSQVPASITGVIPIPYMGRTIKAAGDRNFQPWTCTIMEDEDWAVRNALEKWNSDINTFEGNMRNYSDAAMANYKTTAMVYTLGKTGNITRAYKLEGFWPSQIGQIQMEWANQNQIIQYDVTFEFDWMEIAENDSPGQTPVA